MELKQGPVSIFGLIFGSLKVANQAFGSVILLCFLVMLCNILAVAVSTGIVLLVGKQHPLMMLLQIPLGLFSALLGVVFTTAIIQIIADRIEGTGFGAMECFKGAFLPSVYFIISSILLSIPVFLILLGAAFSGSAWVVALVYIGLGFGMLPFMFTQYAITLRGEGPLSGLQYSWRLVSAHYGRVLFVLLSIGVLCILLGLVAACAVKAFLPQLLSNPMALQFQLMMWLSTLSPIYLIGAAILAAMIYLYVLITFQAIMTGLFLNLEYLDRSAIVPLPPLSAEKVHADPVEPPQPIQPEDLDISVTQASINTQPDDSTERHLQEVYSATDHLPQTLDQEEDRMPTILFDEDMARQLAENERKMHNQQTQNKQQQEPDEQNSIKISDKPL
ncbi:MAG: hypothetical protein IKN49_04270 [Elusimicrobiaceae bacterium]|nr:hypothetical protein [Elusimicrobiaceae bacterium]